MPIGMLVGTILTSSLSDLWGRKAVLLTQLIGGGIGLLLQGLVLFCEPSPWMFCVFLFIRFLSGVFAATSPIVKAYIGDVAKYEHVASLISYREASATASYIAGPLLAGCLGNYSLFLPIGVAGICALGASLLVYLYMEDSKHLIKPTSSRPPPHSHDRSFLFSSSYIILIQLLYSFGQQMFDTFFPLLLFDRYGFTPVDLGIAATFVSLTVFLVLGTPCYTQAERRLGLQLTATGGLISMSVGLGLLGLFKASFMVALGSIFYGIGLPFFTTSSVTMLNQQSSNRGRGTLLGLEALLSNGVRSLSPPLFGYLYYINVSTCFMTGSLILLTGFGLSSARLWRSMGMKRAHASLVC